MYLTNMVMEMRHYYYRIHFCKTLTKIINKRAVVRGGKRNQLLTESDWTQLPDVSLTAEQKQAWIEYRQALRDFPAVCDPTNPVWPEKPV